MRGAADDDVSHMYVDSTVSSTLNDFACQAWGAMSKKISSKLGTKNASAVALIAGVAVGVLWWKRRPLLRALGIIPPVGHVTPESFVDMPGVRISTTAGDTHVVERYGSVAEPASYDSPSRSPGSRRKGQLIYLVHGFSTPSFFLDDLQKDLASAGHRVIRFDLYGRGWSDTPSEPMTLSLLVSQVAEVILKTKCKRDPTTGEHIPARTPCGCDGVSIVGVSMGGIVASTFAARFPELVRSLVLLSPAGLAGCDIGFGARVLSRTGLLGEILMETIGLSKIGDYKNSMNAYPDPNDEESIRAAKEREASLQVQFEASRRNNKACGRALVDTLRNISFDSHADTYAEAGSCLSGKPILAIWGTEDTVTPIIGAHALKDAIPGLNMMVLNGASHWALNEAHHEVVEAILGIQQ